MGYRLQGERIEHVSDGNILSDGIPFGAVQVPDSGQPIIMLADRQTTGGYAKIACVISADYSKIAQKMAGGVDSLRDRECRMRPAASPRTAPAHRDAEILFLTGGRDHEL